MFVIDDGSADRTAAIVDACDHDWLKLLRQPATRASRPRSTAVSTKRASNSSSRSTPDSYLYRDALRNLVERYLSDPPNTRAVAGTMLVRNSRQNWVTKAQEWDYFHGIAAIKRVQSLYQGTLVAQGAFSLYERATLKRGGRLGGLRRRGHRAHMGDAAGGLACRARRGRTAASPTRPTTCTSSCASGSAGRAA